MTLAELRAAVEAKRASAELRENAAKAEFDAVLTRAKAEGRADLTPDEDQRSSDLLADVLKARTERKAHAAEVAKLDAEVADEARAEADAKTSRSTADRPSYDGVARIGQEARTYRPDTDKRGAGFLGDVAASAVGDFGAMQRLGQHMQEERVERGEYLKRSVGTGAFAGLTVPQYLTDFYAPATAGMRPFADVCNRHDLPSDGMTVNISRITTAASAALQSSENSAVDETNMDDTLLTLNVQTVAGQQTVSLQAVQRGTGIEQVVLQDLFRRYQTTLDSTLINQSSTGLTNVAQATTYTDASPTAAELYPKILGAQANLEAALLGQANPTHAVMHSRRWAWLQSQVGPNWPAFAQPGIDPQAMGTNYGTGYNKGIRGRLPNGLDVVVDNNIATNLGGGTEDEIYVVASDECHLWEDPSAPVFIRAEQVKAANLGVLFVLYGYFAYTFARYTNGSSKISGTGLAAPTF